MENAGFQISFFTISSSRFAFPRFPLKSAEDHPSSGSFDSSKTENFRFFNFQLNSHQVIGFFGEPNKSIMK